MGSFSSYELVQHSVYDKERGGARCHKLRADKPQCRQLLNSLSQKYLQGGVSEFRVWNLA